MSSLQASEDKKYQPNNLCNSQLLSYWCIPDSVQAGESKGPARNSYFHHL